MNLLEDSLLRATQLGGAIRRVSLPQLYAALVADEIEELPALRPHQRHALHALLCQIGALACLATGLSEPPRDAAAWAAGLRALTPDHPDDAPWHLVTDPDRPAFLQAPAPGGISSFKQVETPDALDMLVTAKNHDLKGARMAQPEADDWIFALATLQTMEGFLGAGNYGISRMNGGFANRAAVGLAPASGRMGAHIARDIRRLLVLRPRLLEAYPHYRDDGLALVWLRPWTGADGIDPAELDPFYIEICRRVRLVAEGENLAARVSGSKVAQIAVNKAENGITGDPWAPIEITKQEPKALTIDARGFSYRRLADIITLTGFRPAPLQEIGPEEKDDAFVLVCRALARGQGKTEGYHERLVPVSREAVIAFRRGEVQRVAALAKNRIEDAAKVRGALRLAMLALFQNGKEDMSLRDPSSTRRADARVNGFEFAVDADFFERLWEELPAGEGTAAAAGVRAVWLRDLLERAREILAEVEAGSPRSNVRSYRARARAEGLLNRQFYKDFGHYFPKETSDDAAA